jgi:hypothetical protein
METTFNMKGFLKMDNKKVFESVTEYKVEVMHLKGTEDYIVVITDAADDDFRSILSGKDAVKFMKNIDRAIMDK